jgi:hypothetical protein
MADGNNMGAASVVAAALVAVVGGTAFFFGTANPVPSSPVQPRPTTGQVRETQRQPPSEKLTPATSPGTVPNDKTTKPKPPPPDPG